MPTLGIGAEGVLNMARKRFASIAEAALHCDVSTRTLRRYISSGLLTGYRIGPRILRVDLDEVDGLARPIPTARNDRWLP